MIEVADINLTNLCNAGCPQCQRTSPYDLHTDIDLPLTTWSLEDFKTYFPKNTLDELKEYSFCGTYGDPLMAKDIEPIVYYIMDNSVAKVIITTNGSIRNGDFYIRLGEYCGRRLSFVIDVDGTTEEMHQKYRRRTSLKKSLAALKAISKTKAIPLSQTVLFKHNEMYKEEIEQMAKANGSHFHVSYPSDRFDDGGIFRFQNENGDAEILERAVYVQNNM